MFPIQAHNAYILTLESFVEIPVKATRWKYHHTRKWHSQNLHAFALLGDRYTCPSQRYSERTVVPLCLYFSPLIYSFFFFPSLHKENKKKNQHIVLMYELKKNLFFFFGRNIIPFLDSENRRMLFLREKYFFILVASYWHVFMYTVMSFTDSLIQVVMCFNHVHAPRRSPSFPQTISPL